MKGLALVALAGPVSNVVFAVVLAIVAPTLQEFAPLVGRYCAQGVRLSLYLAIFNLLPVPPLDGSKLLLAAKIPHFIYAELARFGFLLLLVALSATSLGLWMSQTSDDAAARIFQVLR